MPSLQQHLESLTQARGNALDRLRRAEADARDASDLAQRLSGAVEFCQILLEQEAQTPDLETVLASAGATLADPAENDGKEGE